MGGPCLRADGQPFSYGGGDAAGQPGGGDEVARLGFNHFDPQILLRRRMCLSSSFSGVWKTNGVGAQLHIHLSRLIP